jgi:hypothetical protein
MMLSYETSSMFSKKVIWKEKKLHSCETQTLTNQIDHWEIYMQTYYISLVLSYWFNHLGSFPCTLGVWMDSMTPSWVQCLLKSVSSITSWNKDCSWFGLKGKLNRIEQWDILKNNSESLMFYFILVQWAEPKLELPV